MTKPKWKVWVRAGFVRFWQEGAHRREFIYTIIWDTFVLAAAMIGRAGLLWLHDVLPQGINADRGIQLLDWVAERAMVVLAVTFAVFDLSKRVWAQLSDLIDVIKGRNRSEGQV